MRYYSQLQRNVWSHRSLILILLIFIGAVAAKLNLSSISIWDYYLKGANTSPQGVLVGSPQGIRSDEWMLGVPWTLSQLNSNPTLSPKNPSIGAGTSALLVGLPTNHWSIIFRPVHWGYLFLDTERAFSWQWMTMSFGLIVCLFLLFKKICADSTVLALTGSLWIYFSGFTQWWFASLASLLLAFSAACLSFAYLWQSKQRLSLILSAIALFFWSMSFALNLYPPFQIPLLYLGVALLPILAGSSDIRKRTSIVFRIAALIFVVAACISFLLMYLHDNQETVSIMQQTAYPGQRVSLGGGFDFTRYFSGIFDSTYLDGRLPLGYGNVCEASSYLLLWPISLLAMFAAKGNGKLLRLTPLILYLIWTTIWVIFGANDSLAQTTLWSYVPSNRALIGLGFGSIVFVILALGHQSILRFRYKLILIFAMGIGLFFFTRHFDKFAQDLLPNRQLFYAAVGTLLIIWSIISYNRWMLMLSVFLAVSWPNSLINPLVSGMDSVLEAPLYKAVKSLDPDKSELWAVYGSHIAPQLVKAAGAKVMNGAKYAPDLALFSQLDPDGKYVDIYNRYAHGILNPAPEGAAAVFHLTQADTWQLDLDPCHPALRKAGIRYVVFLPRRKDLKYSCLEPVRKGPNFSILKRTDY